MKEKNNQKNNEINVPINIPSPTVLLLGIGIIIGLLIGYFSTKSIENLKISPKIKEMQELISQYEDMFKQCESFCIPLNKTGHVVRVNQINFKCTCLSFDGG